LNIGLYGRTGAGKTSVADYLVKEHGFVKCATGAVCRQICRLLFNSESKTLLNQVTDALKEIDQNVWLRAALSTVVEDRPIVFDSMRFTGDYRFLTAHGFATWKISAPLNIRTARLQARGQDFDAAIDDHHRGEVELENHHFDTVIENVDSRLSALYEAVEKELQRSV
jgi:dephospho-CoA kinase